MFLNLRMMTPMLESAINSKALTAMRLLILSNRDDWPFQ